MVAMDLELIVAFFLLFAGAVLFFFGRDKGTGAAKLFGMEVSGGSAIVILGLGVCLLLHAVTRPSLDCVVNCKGSFQQYIKDPPPE